MTVRWHTRWSVNPKNIVQVLNALHKDIPLSTDKNQTAFIHHQIRPATWWPTWSGSDGPHSSTKPISHMTRLPTRNPSESQFYKYPHRVDTFCSGEAFSGGQNSEKSLTTSWWGRGLLLRPSDLRVSGFKPCFGLSDCALEMTRLEISQRW